MAEAVLTNTNDPVPPGHATAPHAWKLDDIFTAPTVNVFALDSGFHNGPQCVACGLTFCHHCHPEKWASECPVASRCS